ncbi:NAD(P)-dependent oxidoreductase [Luteolibacter yonseiensis]|uniref:NAD(P)-dependent oxidoreductase n=1 Tax=Luteolibacter yonseiensis TaxID=1144680 RepID=A0A934R9W7_9BACT|nr:NAD(P)-dependent oxidoreductase [Luteolibacter yonseiensis]MBK1817840.1 NAD(P)-dependent oxidoreductase [Luteolibacter yonseiensis]
MSSQPEQRAAVLGLGIIGSRACSRLADAGWQVRCWNRTPKGNAGETASPEAAIDGASIISLYLKDAIATREVVGRIAEFLIAGQTVLNHATLDLDTTLWMSELCESRGCRFLDTPFTGSKVASANGQLVYYTGGDEALAKELEPYLAVTSKARIHCGAVGSATVVKLATNLISACTVQAMAESLAIATSHGVSAQCLIDAVSQNACASVLTGMKFPSMAAGDFDTHFSLSNMGKDSRYMLALAQSAGLETPAIAAVSKRMGELDAAGLGDLDYSAVVKPYQTGA